MNKKHKKVGKVERVVVYGTLLTGERNAHWAGDAKRTPCRISGNIFDTGYRFPAFVHQLVGDDWVEAEILETDEAGLAHMDILEGYPSLYTREIVPCYLADGKTAVNAWVYVMNELPEGAKRIKCGDWRAYRLGCEMGLKAFVENGTDDRTRGPTIV